MGTRYSYSAWVAAGFALMVLLQGCAGTSPQRMIEQNDLAGLAAYYAREARMHQQKAYHWERLAELYEGRPEPHGGKIEPARYAAHCRAIAQLHRKGADEAESLAAGYRELLPPGTVK